MAVPCLHYQVCPEFLQSLEFADELIHLMCLIPKIVDQ